jgi:hypothetical protein
MKRLEIVIIYLLLLISGFCVLIYSIFDSKGLDDIATQLEERQEI